MPSLSASQKSHPRIHRPLAAAGLITWLLALCASGCRDMREDANFCSTCTGAENPDGTMASPQDSTPSSEAQSTTPPSASGGRTAGSATSTSNQAGNGNNAQGASAAAPSSGSGGPTAGARGPQAGAAARGGNGANSGTSGNSGNSGGRDAGASDSGSEPTRDAGRQEPQEPQEPEPTPDAGQMTPALPCNGSCPNDRPVCDETKATPQCVQCTAEEQFACVGATSTCDVEQQKCVQCTPEDARHCDGATPTCNKDNRCVVCTADLPTSCPAAQPLCDNEQRCVECLPGRTENCTFDRSMCNADGRCVACMNDSHCTDPSKPRCDTQTNSCVGCEGNSDCTRFPVANVCDRETNRCVACSPTGEPCAAGQYCDRNLYQCVPGLPKKRGCERCSTDSDCADSPTIAACIESQQDNDRFCFVTVVAATPVCEQGYAPTPVRGRDNLMYCMPVSTLSCPAIASALSNKECSNANECGRNGQCPMEPDNTCKVRCSDNQSCPAPMYCDAQVCKRP